MFDRLASPGGSLTFRGSGLQLNQPQHPLADSPGDPPLVGWVSDVLLV